MRALPQRVVLRVFENDLEFGMLVGRGLDVRVHLHAPRFAQIALAHADVNCLTRRGLYCRRALVDFFEQPTSEDACGEQKDDSDAFVLQWQT